MIITISGPPGSGKTTVADLLARECGLHLISAGKLFREMAERKRMNLKDFGLYAEENENIDRELDDEIINKIRKHSEETSLIVDGRLSGYLVQTNNIDAFKVWIDAPLGVRAKRISGREKKDYDKAMGEIIERENSEKSRYKSIYGIDIGNLKVYDLIINSQNLAPENIVRTIRDEAGV